MLSTRKGPFRAISGEDITIIAEIRLPFRLVIVVVLAACKHMNYWELSINLVRRMGLEFEFDSQNNYDDKLIVGKNWNGSIKPKEEEPTGNGRYCIDEIDFGCQDVIAAWCTTTYHAASDVGSPQANSPDVEEQVRQLLDDIDEYGAPLPY